MMTRLLLTLMFLLPVPAMADSPDDPSVGQTQYRVQSAVWCSGQLRGEPELLLEAGKPGQFEIDSPESSWRLRVEVEAPGTHEGAGPDSLWFKVGIDQKVDGDWEFLTETMLGVPPGRPGRITVAAPADSGEVVDTSRENAPLYVELSAEPVRDRS